MLSKKFRFKIAKAFNWKCVYCGCRVSFYPEKFGGKKAHIDHIIPLSRGGNPKCEKNLVLSCETCNIKKSNEIPYPRPIISGDTCECEECRNSPTNK